MTPENLDILLMIFLGYSDQISEILGDIHYSESFQERSYG